LNAQSSAGLVAFRIETRRCATLEGHLDVETTIEDLKFYNKPCSFKVTHLLEVDSDIVEYFCNEAEKDLAHMTTVK